MSNTLVKVFTQYVDENGKNKGCQEFFFRADADIFMYAEQEFLVSVIQKMIDTHCINYIGNHIYIEHELVFHEPIELKSDFEKIYDEMS
jgi:hypothetical protein